MGRVRLVVTLLAVMCSLGIGDTPAEAEVGSASGSAFGVSAGTLASAQPSVTFTDPPDGPGPFTDSLPSLSLLGGNLLNATGMSVSTGQAPGGLGTAGASSHSTSDIQQVAYRVDELTGGPVHSECSATAAGASASASFGTVSFSENGVFQTKTNYAPPPNTTVDTGFGETLVFNQQVSLSSGQTTGVRVNALRIQRGSAEIILGQSVCTVTSVPGSVHTTLEVLPNESSGFSGVTGVPFTYTYFETNDGTRPLAGVTVVDDNCSPITFDTGDSNGDGILDPDESWSFTCTRVFDIGGFYTGNVTTTAVDTLTGQVHTETATSALSVLQMSFFDPISGMWIDPRGSICASTAAQVTLLRSDTPTGPFAPVPDGSPIMSPDNRTNPDSPRPDGTFRWDVVPGFYKLRLASLDASESVDSDVLQIPPAVTDVALRLSCPAAVPRSVGTARVAFTGSATVGVLAKLGALFVLLGSVLVKLGKRTRPSR